MEIDFDAADNVSDFVTIPAGTYLCRIAEVRTGSTRAGDDRWSLRLVVAEGRHVGKQAAWDSLVFSARGRARARLVFSALGLPANGRVQVEAKDLEGRQAFVQVRPAEYTAPSGDTIRRNEVPYDGYRPKNGDGGRPVNTDGDRPDDDDSQSGNVEAQRPRRKAAGADAPVDHDQIPF